MELHKTSSCGSFLAWGAGFGYHYEAEHNSLNITHKETRLHLARVRLNRHMAENPKAFVEQLNKAHEIKALILSNNETIKLADTIDAKLVGGIIKNSARLAKCAHELSHHSFSNFSRRFIKEFEVKKLKIKTIKNNGEDQILFVARLQTLHNNSVCVRACTLEGLLSVLSERTLRDLITMEFGHQYQNSAFNLMRLSAKLSKIGNILDENFIPEKHIRIPAVKRDVQSGFYD